MDLFEVWIFNKDRHTRYTGLQILPRMWCKDGGGRMTEQERMEAEWKKV